MRMRIGFVIMTLFLVIVSPYRTQAVNYKELLHIYYFDYDRQGKLYWVESPMIVQGGLSTREKAEAVFTDFFEGGQVVYMPEDVRLLSVTLDEDSLYVNVSDEILQYGGSYFERCLKNQIIKTALHIPGVENVTLLVDGRIQSLSEGSRIQQETEWLDLQEEDGY